MGKSRIALKPFLDTIENLCKNLSRQELTSLMIAMAKGVSTSERVHYLDQLRSHLPGGEGDTRPVPEPIEEILEEIEALKESIEERTEAIENGSFWDDPDSWGDENYYEDDPDYVDNDQLEELEAFFEDAEQMFLEDRLAEARQVYGRLLKLTSDIDGFTFDTFSPEFDVREARARYYRCVYETETAKNRLTSLADAMQMEMPDNSGDCFFFRDDAYPSLKDVMDARAEVIPDLETFLPAWQAMLSKKKPRGRVADLLIEVVFMTEGIEGVARLSRQWKGRQPKGYLFWLDCVQKKGDYEGVLALGDEALAVMRPGPERERAAEFMITAAHELKDKGRLLSAQRERFFSSPNDENLLALIHEARGQKVLYAELDLVLDYFKSSLSLIAENQRLYIKVLLMTGQLDTALEMAKNDDPLGWSYSDHAGIVFASALHVVANYAPDAAIIRRVMAHYAERATSFSGAIRVNDETGISFTEAIEDGLKAQKYTKKQKQKYLAWAESIGFRRIEKIVSAQHRGAYDRAAQVMGALAEAHVALQQTDKAKEILQTYFYEKFRRFSAFRREVTSIWSASPLLKRIKIR